MNTEQIKALAVRAERANSQRDYNLYASLMRGLSREDRRAVDAAVSAIVAAKREANPPHYFR